MFQITGTWKGKTVEDEIVSVTEIIEEMNLPINLNTDRIRFRLNRQAKGVVGINMADGKEKYANRRTFSPIANGIFKNSSISIRWFERRNKRPEGYFVYSPSRIEYSGDITAFNPKRGDELEKAAMLYLLNSCKNSPLRKRSDPAIYEFYDASAFAKKEIQGAQESSSMIERILKMTDEDIKIFGYAVKEIKHNSLSKDTLANADSTKAALVKMTVNDLATLHRALNAPDVQLTAKVRAYQDDGKIRLVPGQSGRNVWYFAEELGGEEIFAVPSGKPHVKELSRWLLDPTNWKFFIGKLRGNDGEQESQIQTSPLAFDPEDPVSIVKAGIEQGVIKLNPTESKVYLFDGKHFQDKALRNIDDPENWKTELIDKATPQMAGRVLKLLK